MVLHIYYPCNARFLFFLVQDELSTGYQQVINILGCVKSTRFSVVQHHATGWYYFSSRILPSIKKNKKFSFFSKKTLDILY